MKARFRLSPKEKEFIRHNKRVWGPYAVEEVQGTIVLDIFEVEEILITYSYFANILARKYQSKIVNYIYGYNLVSHKYNLIYKSFNTRETVRILATTIQKKEVKRLYQNFIAKLKTREDLFNFHIEGCHIGIDIYESYLRDYNQYTVNLDDENLQYLIKAAITIYIFWRDYFEKNKVKAYVNTHDSYVWMNIGCKIAYKNNIPVYLPNARGATYCTEPFSIQACYKNYPKIFNLLSEEAKKKAMDFSMTRLHKRFSGAVGVDMFYSTAASFGETSGPRQVKKSDKIKILVATHCFFDNPHAFQILPFLDFYDWMIFLGEISEETNYDWYVKIHPDPLPDTEEIIRSFIKKYPKFNYIHHNIKHNQLIEEGIDVALTCYGSIGEEYPYYDKLVINTGYNPRVAYDFNVHSNTQAEYRRNLLNIPKLLNNYKVDKNQLYEFYYVHNILNWVDDMLFNSYYEFLEKLTDKERRTCKVYRFFLDQFSEEYHQKILNKYESFIASRKKNIFSIGPVE